MDISLIQVPYHAGDDRHGSSEGPRRVLEGGALDRLRALGHRVSVELAEREGPFRDTASSSAAVNKQVAAKVAAAIGAGRLPIVLAGSCVTCQGVLAGFDHTHCGAVWLDAHADFNTPATTATGFFPGMSLAVATGHCYGTYWAQIGDNTPLAEENVLMFGVRDLWPEGERLRLEESRIKVVPWRDGRPEGDMIAPFDALAQRVEDIYLHIDFDCFAPGVAPAIVDEPVPGGLSLADAGIIIRATCDRFRLRVATLATYTPDNDDDDKTLRLALRLIDLIAESAASTQT
jgi:arginase